MTPQQSQPHLVRVLGPWMAIGIVVGTVIGSGVFKKGNIVAQNVPEFGLAISVWVLGGVLALLGSLSIAEVAVLYPRAGGSYVFLREAYGRWAGFLWGWVDFWIIRSSSIAALGTMFTESLHEILRQTMLTPEQQAAGMNVLQFWPRQAITLGVIAALTILNARGTRLGGGVQLVITFVKVLSLVLIIVLPLAILGVHSNAEHTPSLSRLTPVLPVDWSTVDMSLFGAALVGVLWAYHGWLNITPIAEEVRDPSRNIPLALLGGVLTLIVLYCGANAAYYFVVPQQDMANLGNRPVATEFCLRLLGAIGGVIASGMLLVSVFGALNGNLLVGPRLLYAMGKDRLAPRRLSTLHPQFNTPIVAAVVLSLWSCTMLLIVGALTQNTLPPIDLGFRELDVNLPKNKSPFDVVTDFCMFGAVCFETLSVASIFVFRHKIPPMPENRPYRCWGYPVVPALYVLIMSAVFANMFATEQQRSEAVVGLTFIGIGALVYLIFLGRRSTQAG